MITALHKGEHIEVRLGGDAQLWHWTDRGQQTLAARGQDAADWLERNAQPGDERDRLVAYERCNPQPKAPLPNNDSWRI